MYLRFACVPSKMWEWFYAYIDEPTELSLTRAGKKTYVIATRSSPSLYMCVPESSGSSSSLVIDHLHE